MKKIIIMIIIASIMAIAVFFLYQSFRQPDVTIEEAGEKMARQYNGTVVQSEETNGQFIYTIQVASQGEYKMTVNSETGELMTMTRIQPKEEDAPRSELIREKSVIDSQQAPPKIARQLTAEEAGQIALTHVPGVIDEVEPGDEEEAGSYIVDIDTENGDEAKVQVNAISGDVISISWDD